MAHMLLDKEGAKAYGLAYTDHSEFEVGEPLRGLLLIGVMQKLLDCKELLVMI